MSWYSSFLDQLDNENTILEKLSAKAAGNGFSVSSELITSWKITASEVHRLKSLLDSSQNTSNEVGVVFEYEIARRSKRIDLVILYKSLVFCVEFKTGQEDISLQNLRQVEEYALDLRDFHLESKEKIIIPILATGLQTSKTTVELESLKVNTVGIDNLSESIIDSVTGLNSDDKTNLQEWINSPYKPTPNIIEAAKSLYINNTVADIANYGSVNLTQTVDEVQRVIEVSKKENLRSIIFITGVPGSGKTLAGLEALHKIRNLENEGAVFVSGNGPLVEILREAIAINQSELQKISITEARRQMSTLIDHAYKWRNYYLNNTNEIPPEHILLFDEAQRAWTKDRLTSWSSRQGERVEMSEPEAFLKIMERVSDWSVVVCLVGGGQEINTGEEGLSEWGEALEQLTIWKINTSPKVLDETENQSMQLYENKKSIPKDINISNNLHLEMNVRSPRAEKLNNFVDSILQNNIEQAKINLPSKFEYPIYLTRDLKEAKDTLRQISSGRYGLLASSQARRLRAFGVETNLLRSESGNAQPNWFLKQEDDIRSSYSLEIPATEYDCQGLEIDYGLVAWGGDTYFDESTGNWVVRKFKGTKWQLMRSEIDFQYGLNRYRVLLTRSRKGMVIFVPKGDNKLTTNKEFYNGTFNLLKSLGLEIV
mgnify:FL=1